ncbi:MAG: hypothetical protein R3D01_04740 [Hyphomicrobiales bacterium]
MTSSTMSLADRLDWHPVHRATALLRQALLSTATPAPDPAEIWDDGMFRLDQAPADLAHGPVSIAHPVSLAELLGLPASDEQNGICQPSVTDAADGSAATAPSEDASEEDAMLDGTAQLQLQNMVAAFYERQRQASMLVACSVAAAFALTFVGLVLLFSLTDRAPAAQDGAAPEDGTSMARHAEVILPLIRPDVRVKPNRSAKASLVVPATAGADLPPLIQASTGPQVIVATPLRPLALGPLLPLGPARYLLLRGLPDGAELSGGRRTDTGTWMIKAADMPGLTLTLGANASGDYPLEAYLLDAESGPQARRNLVLRIDNTPQIYAAGLGLGWPMASPAASEPPVDASPGNADVTREHAQSLLDQGDVAEARALLTDLAERGDANAAYELALTYDSEVLAKAGLDDVDGDDAKAHAWYQYAANEGHAGAAQRLQTLAKPRGGA